MPALPPFPTHIEHAAIDWREQTPMSRAFGDVYFSVDGAVAEARYVFIDHNDLPARFRAGGFHVFTIAETGFGTGLNFLVAAQAFLADAPAEAILHFVSCEKYPLTLADLERAHAHWPELAAIAGELRAALPPACTSFHRRSLCNGRVRLTLLQGDAAALLPRLQAQVDAWFLDGFSPAKNADLWTPGLFSEMARLSRDGTTFATFTAASAVRAGLQEAGFSIEKVDGFGHKRDMLRGAVGRGHGPLLHKARRRAAVVGGGLAGCASARALAERGWDVTLFERNGKLADETSGNIAGAVYPKFSLHETAQNRWYRDSYLYALARLPQVLGAADGVNWDACGLLQLQGENDDLPAIANTGRWPAEVLAGIDATTASRKAGIGVPGGGLWFAGAAWVHPPALCAALAAHDNINQRLGCSVQRIACTEESTCVDGEHFDAVIIANALAANQFPHTASLPLRRVRGQVTHVQATAASQALHCVVCHEGYVTPARRNTAAGSSGALHCVGATFSPRDPDNHVRDDDHRENLGNLAAACPEIHAALGGADCAIAGGRTGFRAQSPDYLPIIGAVVDAEKYAQAPPGTAPPRHKGVYVLTALGAKGIAFSLLGAEIIAAQINGEPLPVDRDVVAALDPGRFLQRARRRAAR